MARRKARPSRNAPPDPRLGVLAQEMGLAAAQTLKEEFGFTPDEIARFMDAWLARAKANREGLGREAA